MPRGTRHRGGTRLPQLLFLAEPSSVCSLAGVDSSGSGTSNPALGQSGTMAAVCGRSREGRMGEVACCWAWGGREGGILTCFWDLKEKSLAVTPLVWWTKMKVCLSYCTSWSVALHLPYPKCLADVVFFTRLTYYQPQRCYS